jgi:hypothetical protein
MSRLALLALVVAAWGLVLSPRAFAQGAPQMELQADRDTLGVGDVLHVQLSVESGGGEPSEPQLGPAPAFTVLGQNSAPSQTHIIANGTRIDRFGLTVDWSLQARKTGTFRIGPASVAANGARYATRSIAVRVVPAGQAPAPPAPRPSPSPFSFSPFDPWKGLFPGFDQPEPQAPAPVPVTVDPKLSLDAPRGAHYFLRAAVDTASAVVGEQVTFTVYEYTDPDSMTVEIDGSVEHEPSASDFIKHSLLRDDQDAPLAGYASVGGHVWVVKIIRRWALFPLRVGDLEIGPMSENLVRPRGTIGRRTTDALHVQVSEPPLAGRPPGYALGDVGRFSLEAKVEPRAIDQGGALGVHVEMAGRGNVPATLAAPAREGVEWLTPEVHEQLGLVTKEKFGGKRTFDYVVRVYRAGDVDLGELALPFWDPDAHRYEVARAHLGVVRAKAAAPAAGATGAAGASGTGASPREEALAGLPGPHDTLEGMPSPRAHRDDSAVFWLAGVAGWPLAFGVAVAGRASSRRMRRAWLARRASPAHELRERLAAARTACEKTDARSADAAIARALEAATVVHAGVNVRGAVGDEVTARLERAGIGKEAAAGLAELLRECDAARFAPDAVDVVSARDRWARAQGAIRQLERAARQAPIVGGAASRAG